MEVKTPVEPILGAAP